VEIVRRVHSMKEISRQARRRGLRLGFVPTMGYLHEGHLSLVRRLREQSDISVVSVFVNPTQFGQIEDLDSYPSDMARDADLAIAEGVDYLFTPETHEIYPGGPRTTVDVGDLSNRLEGASRAGHFQAVATVVMKLFQIVQPTIAAFGQKDAQQVVVIKQMVEDMMLDVEICAVPTVRDDDGLALSSRNARLSPEERQAALAIPRALDAAAEAAQQNEAGVEQVLQAARDVLEAEPRLRVDYVKLVDPARLEPLGELQGEALLLIAAFAGEIRLIDNATIGS